MKALALPLVLALALPLAAAARSDNDKDKRPSISLKATPALAFSPARVVVTADIKGGANDFEEFYCATVEWDWGDGTRSDDTMDCDPYQPGKSEIRRHFTVDRVFRTAGDYRVQFRLKKKDKVIGSASTSVKIRPGLGDPGGG